MIFSKHIIFRNKRLLKRYSFKSRYDYEEVFLNYTIENANYTIHALHLKSIAPKGAVFFSHGTLKHIQYHLPKCYDFLDKHYDVFIWDYPKYGKSRGKLIATHLHSLANCIMQDLVLQYFNENEVVLAGRSLGTVFASNISSNYNSKHLILVTPYVSMDSLFKLHLKREKPFKRFRYNFDNQIHLNNNATPITILHGTHDNLIPLDYTKQLQQYLKVNDNFVVINQANHFNIHEFDDYKNTIGKILV
ncbi:MAG: alpha/beta hydrolase [Chitinophagales bacterium]|nr:alpha/beta hydrolase [Chitinophagales bacterium]